MISECIYIYYSYRHIFFVNIHITSRWSKQVTSHHQSMAVENLTWRGRPPTCGRSGRRGGVPRGKRPCARLGRGRRCGGGSCRSYHIERTRCFTRSRGGVFSNVWNIFTRNFWGKWSNLILRASWTTMHVFSCFWGAGQTTIVPLPFWLTLSSLKPRYFEVFK